METAVLKTEPILASGKNQGLNVWAIRKLFPMLKVHVDGKPLVYFDSAATNHKPRMVIDHLTDLYTQRYGKTQEENTFSQMMTSSFEDTRSKVASFLCAKSACEIVITSGTTSGINLVANGFAKQFLKENDEIVISVLEHHSNIIPWQIAAEQTGAKVVVASITSSGELELDAFEKLLNEKTKIVSISHSSNVLGTILPVKEIVQIAHKRGIPVFVDGAQAAPHMPVNVQDMDCDFYAFSAHKMGGPAGVGFLYGKQEWLDQLPPLFWGRRDGNAGFFRKKYL